MIQFDAAPPIPLKYPRLAALTAAEIGQACAAGYIAEETDPGQLVQRAGLDNCSEDLGDYALSNWLMRTYVIWFCYLYENFQILDKPLFAIEELVLEFKAPDLVDLPDRRIATLYAGAGGAEPCTQGERLREVDDLSPHYAKAIALLDSWSAA